MRCSRSYVHLSFAAASILFASACAHHDRMELEPASQQIHHQGAAATFVNESAPPIIFGGSKRVLVKNSVFGAWQPSFGDAVRADAGAGDFVRAQHPEIFAKLSIYVAQIFGVTNDDGQRLVEMSFMCNVSLEEDSNSPAPTAVQRDLASSLLEGPASCNVGGDCCFQLYFDPVSGLYQYSH